MTNRSSRIDASAIALICKIAQRPSAQISGKALADHFPLEGLKLVDAGLLKRHGDLPVAAATIDPGDELTSVRRSPIDGTDGYFDPTRGWVLPSEGETAIYKLDFQVLLGRLLAGLHCTHAHQPDEVAAQAILSAGAARNTAILKGAEIWIARRLADPEIWSMFLRATDARPTSRLRPVICLMANADIPDTVVPGHMLIGLEALLGPEGKLCVDVDLLAHRLGPITSDAAEITLSADGAIVTVHGKKYRFTGTKQRAAIRHLYEAWTQGMPDCLTTEVLEAASCALTVNTLAKLFGGRTDWRDFISEQRGSCRIDI